MDTNFASDVADFMGDDWQYTVNPFGGLCVENKKNGLRININDTGATFVSITGKDKLGEQYTFPFSSESQNFPTSIGFNISKGAKKVAGDIVRKMLSCEPNLHQLHEIAKERETAHLTYVDKILANHKALLETGAVKQATKGYGSPDLSYRTAKVAFDGKYGYDREIRINGDTVDIHLNSVPVWLAVKIFSTMKAEIDKKEADKMASDLDKK